MAKDPDIYAEIIVNEHTVGYDVATPATPFSGRRYIKIGVVATPPVGALRVTNAYLADITRWTAWRTPWPWAAIAGGVAVGGGIGLAYGRSRK
jgi:hypothetical protein